MTDLRPVAATLTRELSARYSTDIVTPDSWQVVLARIAAQGAALGLGAINSALAGWAREAFDALDPATSSRSVCLPQIGGDGAVVVMSAAALADPVENIETIAHEHEHARVLKADADVQVLADYLNGEMRATVEARAYAVGAFARYLVTGAWQTADEIVQPLAHGYALDAATREHCAVIVASALASMRAGVVPPFEVCGVVLEVLRAKHPEAIVPDAFKVRP